MIFRVSEESAGMRLDAWLAAEADITRSAAARLIEGGRVKLNGITRDYRR